MNRSKFEKSIALFFQHRSIQILLIVSIYLLIAQYLPMKAHQAIYTLSLLIKDLLLWMLPITVAFFIANAITSFEKKAPLFIITLFAFEAFSNSASVWYAYGCGHIAANHLSGIEHHTVTDTFEPLWRLPLIKPTWWSADKGTFAGILFGLLAVFKVPKLKIMVLKGKEVAEYILTRFFSRLIPLFILGFVAKMYKTDLFNQLSTQYADLLLWLVVILCIYISFLFAIGSNGFGKTFAKSVHNLLPATGMAFSSGCSLSTMPWTIEGTSKNLKDKDLAKAVIPATTNIQQIGDCIANTFLCFLIYRYFKGYNPDFATWLSFSTIFVLARFATAAVLGGAIFIMLPIYESYLGFSHEMTAMILAFNVILDPL